MNHNSTTAMAAIQSLEERLSLLLQQLDFAVSGQTASLGSENASPSLGEPGQAHDLTGQSSQLLDRMEQILLEKNFANESDRSPANEVLFATWQAQLDRIERQLESLREAIPAAARFE